MEVKDGTKTENEGTLEPTLLEKATKEREAYEKATAERMSLVVREEKLAAQKMLGGTTEAGQPAEKPKELTPAEYRDAVMRGDMNAQKTK